jgi:Tfp pilus assembly protein PilO
MTPPIDRQFFANLVIIIGVCVGAWMLVVEPKIVELAKLEGEIAESKAAPTVSAELISAAAQRTARTTARVEEIAASNRMAEDSSAFYGLVMDLGDKHGVQIKSMQPKPSQKASADAAYRVMRIDLAVEGRYEKVAAFLEDVQNIPAFTKPLSLTLSPSVLDDERAVTAAFSCGILSFTIPSTLTSSGGTNDAQR